MLFEISTDNDPESIHKEWLAVYDKGEYLSFACEYISRAKADDEYERRKTWYDAGICLDKKHIPTLIRGLRAYLDSQ